MLASENYLNLNKLTLFSETRTTSNTTASLKTAKIIDWSLWRALKDNARMVTLEVFWDQAQKKGKVSMTFQQFMELLSVGTVTIKSTRKTVDVVIYSITRK